MKLCIDTITVFNAKHNRATDKDDYNGTVISGVSWFCEIVSNTETTGLRAANRFTVRIPESADFSGKSYADPIDYASAEDVSDKFTFGHGDIVVHGAVETTGLRPAQIQKLYEAFTILGVTDNRRAPNAPHWKVVGS